ncbi:MAG: EamA family transporter [Clostridia bacterium]|nr:EamA family transporter [Clostridia bacterium]
MWQYVVLVITAAVLTLQSLFAKLYSNHYTGEDKFSSPVFSVFYGFIVAIITLISAGFSYAPSKLTVVLGLMNGIFLFVYNSALIEGSRRGPYSFVMICNLFGGVLVPMFVMMFMPRLVELFASKESSLWFTPQNLTILQGIALVLVLVAFVLLNLTGKTQQKPKRSYYLWILLLGLVNGGYSTVLALQSALRPDDKSEVLVTTFAFGGLFSLIYLLLISKKKFVSTFRMSGKAWFFALGACGIATLAVNLLTYVLSLFDNAAIVNATSNGCILIFSALSSFLLFKEKMNFKQLIGAALCVGAIILLNF